MIKTKEYNNVKTPPQLKRNEVKVFQYLNVKADKQNPGKVIMPSVHMIPGVDRVYDKESDDYIDIASIASLGLGGKPTFNTIQFTKQDKGLMVLRGSKTGDREIFQYLMLSNYNASNSNRDTSIVPLFKLVEPKKDAADSRKNRTLRRDAMNVAAELSAAEVREFIAALNKDEKRDISILRDELEIMAEKNPQQFITLSKDKNKSIQATCKAAIDKKIIRFDKATSTFYGFLQERLLYKCQDHPNQVICKGSPTLFWVTKMGN